MGRINAAASLGAAPELPIVTQAPPACRNCHTPWVTAFAALPTMAIPPRPVAAFPPPAMELRLSVASEKPKPRLEIVAPAGSAASSATTVSVVFVAWGRSFAGRTDVVSVTAFMLLLNRVLPPDLPTSSETSAIAPVAGVPALSSTRRATRVPGVPWKSAAGTNRRESAAFSSRAAPALTGGRLVQVLPSLEYCQTPCAAIALLVVMAMPAKPFATDPPATLSSSSTNLDRKRLSTVAPGRPAPPPDASSPTGVSSTAVASARVGASLTPLTVAVNWRVVSRTLLVPSS